MEFVNVKNIELDICHKHARFSTMLQQSFAGPAPGGVLCPARDLRGPVCIRTMKRGNPHSGLKHLGMFYPGPLRI